MLEQTGESARPPPAFLLHRLRLDVAHPRERGLGPGEEGGEDRRDDDQRDEKRVVVHRSGLRWNSSSSSRSRRSIAVASVSSTWSMPIRCKIPCTISSAS